MELVNVKVSECVRMGFEVLPEQEYERSWKPSLEGMDDADARGSRCCQWEDGNMEWFWNVSAGGLVKAENQNRSHH